MCLPLVSNQAKRPFINHMPFKKSVRFSGLQLHHIIHGPWGYISEICGYLIASDGECSSMTRFKIELSALEG